MKRYTYKLSEHKLDNNRVFRDAIHGYIEVDNSIILQLINTKEMQRLRRIKQLGGTYQVYHSAEHSRFTHSLGVYHIVRMMCDKHRIGGFLSDYDILTVECAGLLHDIGHGPFSHSFEGAFDLNHEVYFGKIILGDSEVNKVLSLVDSNFPKHVASVIDKTHPNKILIQMISSQLDGDRMDYLLRDSYFTGTTYGQFDLSRILRVMSVKDNQIVIKKTGVQAVEDYILARYQMYWQVYYHPTSRSYEMIFKSIILRCRDLFKMGYDFSNYPCLLPFLKQDIKIKDYLELDENALVYYFQRFQYEKDKVLADLSYRFINRILFDYCDYVDEKHFDKIKDNLIDQGYDPKYYLMSDDMVNVPYLHYGSANQIGEIRVIDGLNLYSLPQVSEIVGAISNSKVKKTDHKLYYPLKKLKV